MQKILLSFVGNQDPISEKTNKEGSIVTLYRHVLPDHIFLYPTGKKPSDKGNEDGNTEKEATDTRDWLNAECGFTGDIYIRPQTFDPVDYNDIMKFVKTEVERLQEEYSRVEDEYELHINCSSGTPQLKSAWLISAYAGFLPNATLWQVSNPQFSARERVKVLTYDFIEESSIIERIKKYSGYGAFALAAQEAGRLGEVSPHAARRDRARLIKSVFTSYEYWDLIRYDKAYEQMNSLVCKYRGCVDMGSLLDCLGQQSETLFRLSHSDGNENASNICDLYYNACRCHRRENYTDTLARFWRIYEGTLAYYLRKTYAIDPDLNFSMDQAKAAEVRKYMASRKKGVGRYMMLEGISDVLSDFFDDKNFKKFRNEIVEVKRGNNTAKVPHYKILHELREKRNTSIVAHGMRPISREDSENALILARHIIGKLMPNGEKLLEGYPFSEMMIRTVSDQLLQNI